MTQWQSLQSAHHNHIPFSAARQTSIQSGTMALGMWNHSSLEKKQSTLGELEADRHEQQGDRFRLSNNNSNSNNICTITTNNEKTPTIGPKSMSGMLREV